MKKKKKAGWIAVILSLATLIAVLMTVHDIQTAQGIGLYFSQLTVHDMQTAQGIGLYLPQFGYGGSRIVFDIMVDILAVTLLVLLLIVPCFLLCWFKPESFFRLLAASLALLPDVDLGRLVHIFDRPGPFALRQSVIEGDLLTAFFSGMKEMEPVLRLGIPILCLLLIGNHAAGRDFLKKWHKTILWCEIPLCLVVFLFPVIAPFLSFFMQYFLLIVCFDNWEQLYQDHSIMRRWGMVLFGGFWLKGVYLMIQAMSVWKL